jgi:acetyl esterase
MLGFLREIGAPPTYEGTPEQGRAGYLKLTAGTRTPEQVVPVGSVKERSVPGAAGALRARVYRPDGDGPFPVVAFFHGGGWVIGDLDTHDNMARHVCRGAPAIVVSVGYRLAPEHPFPAAADDAVAVARWLAGFKPGSSGEPGGSGESGSAGESRSAGGAGSAGELAWLGGLGADGRLAVAGDSAGGNLSAVVAQRLTADGIPLAGQFLIYPAVDAGGGYPSVTENAEGYLLEKKSIDWFLGHYVGPSPDLADPRLSPLHGSLSGLPPALIVTAEYDPLRDEGEAYGRALSSAGVPADVRRYDGMIHGFFDMGGFSPAARTAIEECCTAFGALIAAR